MASRRKARYSGFPIETLIVPTPSPGVGWPMQVGVPVMVVGGECDLPQWLPDDLRVAAVLPASARSSGINPDSRRSI
jgi:hypothetical protein